MTTLCFHSVSLKYSPLKVHLVECISESHSAVDRRCQADVDELPYFGKHSEGERGASEAWGNSSTSLALSLFFLFRCMGEKGGSASGHTRVSRGRGGGPSCSAAWERFLAVSWRAPANRHLGSRCLCEREGQEGQTHWGPPTDSILLVN